MVAHKVVHVKAFMQFKFFVVQTYIYVIISDNKTGKENMSKYFKLCSIGKLLLQCYHHRFLKESWTRLGSMMLFTVCYLL